MMHKMEKKPKSSMFAIYLVEDDSGRITVKSDYHGRSVNAMYLGIEILHNIKLLEEAQQDMITVENVFYSEALQ